MFQGNAAHTGYVPVDLDPNAFSTRWQTPAIDIPVSYPANLNTITASDGQLFIGGGTSLYARKEFDGSTVWQYDFSSLTSPSVNPPSVVNGIVYVAAGQEPSTYMFAFNASDGSLVFKSPTLASTRMRARMAGSTDSISPVSNSSLPPRPNFRSGHPRSTRTRCIPTPVMR